MVKAKNKKGIVKSILKTVSYDTGLVLRKASQIGKITETEPWEKMVSGTQELCQTVGDRTKVILQKVNRNVKKNVGDMKESFVEGMESVQSPCPDKKEDKFKAKVEAKGKSKGGIKKVKQKIKLKKEVPINAEMEKEIDDITKGIEDV